MRPSRRCEDGIIFEEMGGGLHARRIVDAHDVHVTISAVRPASDEVTSDATETVDCDLHLHRRARR